MNQDSKLDNVVKVPMQADFFNLLGIKPYKRKIKMKKMKKESKNKGGIPARFQARMERQAGKKKEKMFTPLSALRILDKDNFMKYLSPNDFTLLYEISEEFYRRGNFVRAFPTIDRISRFRDLFEVERNNNLLVWKWMEIKEKEGIDILQEFEKFAFDTIQGVKTVE